MEPDCVDPLGIRQLSPNHLSHGRQIPGTWWAPSRWTAPSRIGAP